MKRSFHDDQLFLIIFPAVLGAASLLVVILRLISRRLRGNFGKDDYFMVVGEALFIANCTLISIGGAQGLGAKDEHLNASDKVNAARSFFMGAAMYLTALVLVKTSICFNLLRIAVDRRIRSALYLIIALTVICNLCAVIILFSICRPIQAAWIPMPGKCEPSRLVQAAYYLSVTTLITDLACAFIPWIMLWKSQMNVRTKIVVATILGVGFVASTGTIIRLPYVKHYDIVKDNTYYTGKIAVYSVFECGLAIIAGSAAALKPLLGSLLGLVIPSSVERAGNIERSQPAYLELRPVPKSRETDDITVSTSIEIGSATTESQQESLDALCPQTNRIIIVAKGKDDAV